MNMSQRSWADEKKEEKLLAMSTTESKTPTNDNDESKAPIPESKTPIPESKTPNPESPESKTPACTPHYKVTLEADKVQVEEVTDDGEAIPVPSTK